MSVLQFPRLPSYVEPVLRDWSDLFATRLEAIFNAPQLNGLVALSQLIGTADTPGSLTIPSTQNDILLKWGADTIAAASTTQPVVFSTEYPNACWVALICGTSNNLILSAQTILTTGFTATASAKTGTTFNWLAIGN